MSYPLLHMLFYFLFLLLPFPSVAQPNGAISLGAPITATYEATTPWLSPSQDFAFGFKQLQHNNLFLLSIWYYKIPDQTVVWSANQGVPVAAGSKVEVTADKGLVLLDPQGKELWNISDQIPDQVAYGFMNDTGNFVLVSTDSVNLWESFNYPTDTMLPTQIMKSGGVIYSRQSEKNFSRGRFQFRLLEDGNLVLNTRDVATNFAYDAYYRSNTHDADNVTNGYQVIFNETGYMYVLRRSNQRVQLAPTILPSGDYYHRATLDFDGVFTQYYHPKIENSNPQNWTMLWSEPKNICVDIAGQEGRGACGYNSICTIVNNQRPVCSCPEGFSLLDPNDTYGDCNPSFTPSCEENVQPSSPSSLYDLSVLINTDWPTSDYEHMKPISEEMCRNSCLNDCFCAVAILRGDSCWKKKLPLSNGRNDTSVSSKAFMKFRKDNLPPPTTDPGSGLRNLKKNDKTLIIVGSVLLGSSFFINFVLIGAFCLCFFLTYHKKSLKNPNGLRAGETNLRCFTYEELADATDGFKEELGKGAFGIVYKGVIQMGNSRNSAAVKKLDRVVQEKEREKEFRTEVQVIGQTHHKNLVRLLGFCDEREHRMLVYEFMTNGTIASFLFGETKPSWNQRSQIALGIARGLLYLHEECSTQIIHCDIKPQNILLDDYYNARISDFGLAKLLMINQSQTNTGIRGTKGYVAPEWFRSKPVTAKVDVYSFGVVLLEIITCRKNVGDWEMGEEGREILTDWVCDCFAKERLDALVENDLEALNDWRKLERFLMVGIWCIQEDPSLRPTMRKVTQMLEGVVEVTRPPFPSQFSFHG